jgi:hypothetical protein
MARNGHALALIMISTYAGEVARAIEPTAEEDQSGSGTTASGPARVPRRQL